MMDSLVAPWGFYSRGGFTIGSQFDENSIELSGAWMQLSLLLLTKAVPLLSTVGVTCSIFVSWDMSIEMDDPKSDFSPSLKFIAMI